MGEPGGAATLAGIKQRVHVRTGHRVRERPTVIKHCQAELVNSLAHLNLDSFCKP